MRKIKNLFFIVLFFLSFFSIVHPLLATLNIKVEVDSCSQRTDGSKLVDIWYTLAGNSDCIDITIIAVTTASNETLLCETFLTSSDTGMICDNGSHHIIWDAGTDIPGREFYHNKIVFEITAAIPGVVPGDCGHGTIAGGRQHTVALKSNSTVWAWGNNEDGQLGDGTTDDSNTPVRVAGPDSIGCIADIIAIATKEYHVVVLRSDGTVWTWGLNMSGQLGDGTTDDSYIPVQVVGQDSIGHLTDVIDIVGGDHYTAVLKSDSTVWAWGNTSYGRLGDGTRGGRTQPTPVQVVGPDSVGYLSKIIAIAGAGGHTIALRADSTVWAWGLNNDGELGDGTQAYKRMPIQVVGQDSAGHLTDIIAVAAGDAHSIALKSDGTVWTWGNNRNAQLGNGTKDTSYTPVQVVGPDSVGYLTDIIAVAGAMTHTIALKSDGTVWTWGANSYGQLGNDATTNSATPVQVVDADGTGHLTDIVAIAAGLLHTIALKSDGTVWTWGANFSGQLGDGTDEDKNQPVQVHGEDDVGFLNLSR